MSIASLSCIEIGVIALFFIAFLGVSFRPASFSMSTTMALTFMTKMAILLSLSMKIRPAFLQMVINVAENDHK
jgi:hypothetical protein